MGNTLLEIKNLHVDLNLQEMDSGKNFEGNETAAKHIIQGLNLTINKGEIHALMGPNGSGKSTLSNTIMGHPAYQVTQGSILFDDHEILAMPTHERARLGLFMSFQHPVSLPGVTITNFLRTSVNAVQGETPVREFRIRFKELFKSLKLDSSFTSRYVNEGFSGGEKKKLEILQMAMLKPKLAILDEIDSGLDVDALRIVSQAVNELADLNMSILLITHYQRILNIIKPDRVHIFAQGKIIRSGSMELVTQLEKDGYEAFV